MPYIKQKDREQFKEVLTKFAQIGICTPGELNYIITKLLNIYTNCKNMNYQSINDIIGALEGAKLEFYRRVVEKYEDEKIKENGDI
jgi:hypothetical protein